MSQVKMRQEVERKIATALIESLLAAGFTIDVNDGEETTLTGATDKDSILGAMYTTDEDVLDVNKPDGSHHGYVHFIYGNDGWDVISDYTTNLQPYMAAADAISEQYAD